jgi:hypothetical protein
MLNLCASYFWLWCQYPLYWLDRERESYLYLWVRNKHLKASLAYLRSR